jgi:Ca-activated chloride channel family protein
MMPLDTLAAGTFAHGLLAAATPMGWSFAHPGLLWALLLVPLFWFWPKRLADRRHGALRSGLWIVLVAAWAGPRHLSSSGQPVRVVVSPEDPTSPAVIEVRERFALLAERDRDVRHLWVGPPSAGNTADAPYEEWTVEPDRARDLAACLDLTASQLPVGVWGSLVLASSGLHEEQRRTDAPAGASWRRAASRLADRGLPLSVLPLAATRTTARALDWRPSGELRAGHPGRALAAVRAERARVRVRLLHDGKVWATAEANVSERGEVLLEWTPVEAGLFACQLEVADLSASQVNGAPPVDRSEVWVAVQEPLDVLYLGERMAEGQARFAELVGSGFRFAEAPVEGDVVGDLPLERVDVVVLDDRSAASLDEAWLERLVDEVQTRGLGLMLAGGRAAFGPGGWSNTPIDRVNPLESVQKEEKKDPSTSLVIVIDTSGSMSGQRMVLAKEVARLAMRRLQPHDKVGVVEFYGNKQWSAPLQSAANVIDLQRAINRLDAGGGTVLFPGVEEAYYGLRNVQTRFKHVMVITDAGVESAPYEQLLRRMNNDGIALSTVLVGGGRHSEFLVELADWGGGRYYHAPDRFHLPELMLKQPSTSLLPGYRPESLPVRAQGGASWWGAEPPEDLPPLAGYAECEPRPGAQVLLAGGDGKRPILASWQHGAGRVTAFASEPTGAGTEPWQDLEDFSSLMARSLSKTARPGGREVEFTLEREGERARLIAQRRDPAGDPAPLGRPRAQLWEPDGVPSVALSWNAVGPDRWETEWRSAAERPIAAIARSAEDPRPVYVSTMAVSDDVERADPRARVTAAHWNQPTGGALLTLERLDQAPMGGLDRVGRVRQARPWLLALGLLLLLAELLYRRLPRTAPHGAAY